MSNRTIEQVHQEYTKKWMQVSGVEGTAIRVYDEKPCIMIFSSVKKEKLQDNIPLIVEGFMVIIKETGTFQAFGNE